MTQPALTVENGFDMERFLVGVVRAIPRYARDERGTPNRAQIIHALESCGIYNLGKFSIPERSIFDADEALAHLKTRNALKQQPHVLERAIDAAEQRGFEIGTQVSADMADTIRKMVTRALELAARDDQTIMVVGSGGPAERRVFGNKFVKDAELRGYANGIGRSVKAILRAVALYPEWFEQSKNASTSEMLIVIKIAGTRDDAARKGIFDAWLGNAKLNYRDVERMVESANHLEHGPTRRDLELTVIAAARRVNNAAKPDEQSQAFLDLRDAFKQLDDKPTGKKDAPTVETTAIERW